MGGSENRLMSSQGVLVQVVQLSVPVGHSRPYPLPYRLRLHPLDARLARAFPRVYFLPATGPR